MDRRSWEVLILGSPNKDTAKGSQVEELQRNGEAAPDVQI